uniref:O-fucosyltransferase family protein n=1 Tax=Aegilops tauschii subsp. strangulata TaxID=200361 RepID=A0A452XCR5_AEGTS
GQAKGPASGDPPPHRRCRFVALGGAGRLQHSALDGAPPALHLLRSSPLAAPRRPPVLHREPQCLCNRLRRNRRRLRRCRGPCAPSSTYQEDEVKVIRELPQKFNGKVPLSMQPVSWSSEKYYLRQILPLVRKHKVIRFSRTDSRLANNGLPLRLQKLRCHVNYNALRFTPSIEALGNKMISSLRKTGSFVVLHL